MEQRLQKLLAAAGIASRRTCEAIIAAGRVTVNGLRVAEPGAKADPEADDIRVDGKRIATSVQPLYIVLNKPTGCVTTVRDRHASHTVMALVKGISERVYPVGRLDADSAGLLLMTNDGDFTQLLTHPSHQVPKTYRAVVRGEVPEWAGADLRKGILLEDGMTAPAEVVWVDYDAANNATVIDLTIHEGRNRQVRRMFDAIGYPVLALTRTRIGPIPLTGLAPGTWRKLRPAEVAALRAAADILPPSLPQVPLDAPEHDEGMKGRRDEGMKSRAARNPSAAPSAQNSAGAAVRAAADALNARLREDRADDDAAEPTRRKTNAAPRRKPGTK